MNGVKYCPMHNTTFSDYCSKCDALDAKAMASLVPTKMEGAPDIEPGMVGYEDDDPMEEFGPPLQPIALPPTRPVEVMTAGPIVRCGNCGGAIGDEHECRDNGVQYTVRRIYNPSQETPTTSDTMEEFGPVTQGDLSSTERGTGARKSAGKPQWFQVPFFALRGALTVYRTSIVRMEVDAACLQVSKIRRLERIISIMADWQRNFGDSRDGPGLIDTALAETLHFLQREYMTLEDAAGAAPLVPIRALVDVAGVLEFGATKYPFCLPDKAKGQDGRPTPASAGNWAKGMPWSTAFSCAMSHLLKRAAGSVYDEESGKDHMAHVAVNLLFLSAYRTLYPEGDDRIKVFEAPEDPMNPNDIPGGPPADQVHP